MNEYRFMEITFSYKESKCLVQSIDKHKFAINYENNIIQSFTVSSRLQVRVPVGIFNM